MGIIYLLVHMGIHDTNSEIAQKIGAKMVHFDVYAPGSIMAVLTPFLNKLY